MAGLAVELRHALVALGFQADAACVMIDDQGMDDLAEFALLMDTEVENLCKVVRRPGGTITNPNANDAIGDPVPGQPATIRNPGQTVLLRAKKISRWLVTSYATNSVSLAP